jgi:translation initiation factor IF-1
MCSPRKVLAAEAAVVVIRESQQSTARSHTASPKAISPKAISPKPAAGQKDSKASPFCIAKPAPVIVPTATSSRPSRHIDLENPMAKEELIQFEGLVTEILPDARYRVQLDAGHEIVAYTAGKMKKNRIKTLAGDRVTIEMSPYDLEKGRLIFRHKDERPGSAPAGGPPRGAQQRGGQFRGRR